MNYGTETKRCRNLRRCLVALFIVCAYLLSTTYAVDVLTIDGVETYVPMTALNLTFGEMGGDTPVRASKFGYIFLIIPLVGFLFTFFDKKTNIKNVVSLVCGVLGCLSISFFIGSYIGIGSMLSILIYLIIAVLSSVSILIHYNDKKTEDKKDDKSGRRLERHE